MRRLTLGVLILSGGALLSLPFRRSAVIDASGNSASDNSLGGANHSTARMPLDADSLEMLVREVTNDVEIPTLYSPQTDYVPAAPAASVNTMPLTYQDVAVPVDRDPYYANRFNAAVGQQPPTSQSRTSQRASKSQRTAILEQAFREREFVDTNAAVIDRRKNFSVIESDLSRDTRSKLRPRRISPESDQVDSSQTAKFASTGAAGSTSEADSSNESEPASKDSWPQRSNPDRSILTRLPPPSDLSVDANQNAGSETRQRHWIRQPD